MRTLLVVFGSTICKVVQPGTPSFFLSTSKQWFQALVDLNSRDNTIAFQHIDKWLAIWVVLEKCLLEQDGSRDVFTNAFSGEEQVAPIAAVILIVFQTNSLEAGANRAGRLIACEQALPCLHHCSRSFAKFISIFAVVHCWCIFHCHSGTSASGLNGSNLVSAGKIAVPHGSTYTMRNAGNPHLWNRCSRHGGS